MPFAPESDRIRILKHLRLVPADLGEIDSAMSAAEAAGGEPLAAEIVAVLDRLDSLDSTLAAEMGSNQGALIKAGPLEWSEGRYGSVLLAQKSAIADLARLLGLSPDTSDLDRLLEDLGLSGSCRISGLLERS